MRIRLLLQLTILTLSIAWISKIYGYYFDSDFQDIVSLSVVSMLLFAVSRKLPPFKYESAALVIILIFLFASYTIVSSAVLYWSRATFVAYILVGFIGFSSAHIRKTRLLSLGIVLSMLVWLLPTTFLPAQSNYHERLVTEVKTRNGLLHITKWKSDFWYYYNDRLQFSTVDGHMYGEATIHPAMDLTPKDGNVLVIGGETGLLTRELNKYPELDWKLLPLDVDLAYELHAALNLPSPKVVEEDPGSFLYQSSANFDLIIIDPSDARSLESLELLDQEFMQLMASRLSPNGTLLYSVGDKELESYLVEDLQQHAHLLQLNSLSYHTQVPTIGQWEWMLISSRSITTSGFEEPTVETEWYNLEAFSLMSADAYLSD